MNGEKEKNREDPQRTAEGIIPITDEYVLRNSRKSFSSRVHWNKL